MIPAHVKWYVSDGKLFETWLFWGTRKQCEVYIRTNSEALVPLEAPGGSHA
jgi:hypothetical protein